MNRPLKLPAILTLCLIGLGIAAPSNADLVMHLTGDGTTADATGNGHTAVLNNGTTYATGKLGQAFSFDGVNDFIHVAASGDLEPTSISIAFWINTEQDAGLRLLFDSSHGSSNGQFGWATQMNNGVFRSTYGNGSTFQEAVSTTNIADGQFHHVAMTLDGSTLKSYVDGVVESSISFTGTAMGTGDELRMGRHFSLNRQFAGELDDVRLYNHALTDADVATLAMVPEPNSMVALGLGGVVFLLRRRRYS